MYKQIHRNICVEERYKGDEMEASGTVSLQGTFTLTWGVTAAIAPSTEPATGSVVILPTVGPPLPQIKHNTQSTSAQPVDMTRGINVLLKVVGIHTTHHSNTGLPNLVLPSVTKSTQKNYR